ncbi:MAG: hypothetical protein NZM00_11165, partial [Anaerolinea sp.]|nr:hypothetical protein [Anaerolinea sp.]
MSDYQFGAWVVHSTIALNLPVSPCETADVWIDLTEGALRPLSRPFFRHLNADKTVWVAFYHDADGIRVDFPGLAAFLVSADGRFIRCAPEPGLPTETFEHLLLDQVLPRALSHQGYTVLHAAAVTFEGKMIAFLGDTGRGKSTLVRYLVSTGLPFVSDDCLIITSMADPVTGIGSYSGMRLWPDSVLGLGAGADQVGSMAHYGRKRRLTLPAAAQFQTAPLPIAQLFLLAPPVQADGRIQITPVPARERVIH